MKSKILFVASLVLVLFLVASCGPKTAPETTTVVQPEPTPASEPTEPTETSDTGQVEVVETVPTKPTQSYASEIQELLDKAEGTTNYQYFFEGLKKNPYGSDITFQGYWVYIKGDKIKKVYSDPLKISSDAFYNEVYLDTAEKTAQAICSKQGSLLCEDSYGKIFSLEYYNEVLPMTPLSVLEKVPYSVKKVGDVTFANRQVAVWEYDQGNGFVRLMVDKYYGLPLKYEVYTWDDDVEVLQERYTFTKPGVDKLKNADVNIPDEYQPAE